MTDFRVRLGGLRASYLTKPKRDYKLQPLKPGEKMEDSNSAAYQASQREVRTGPQLFSARRMEGVGVLNVETGRGEVKAKAGDYIITLFAEEKIVISPEAARAIGLVEVDTEGRDMETKEEKDDRARQVEERRANETSHEKEIREKEEAARVAREQPEHDRLERERLKHEEKEVRERKEAEDKK